MALHIKNNLCLFKKYSNIPTKFGVSSSHNMVAQICVFIDRQTDMALSICLACWYADHEYINLLYFLTPVFACYILFGHSYSTF